MQTQNIFHQIAAHFPNLFYRETIETAKDYDNTPITERRRFLNDLLWGCTGDEEIDAGNNPINTSFALNLIYREMASLPRG